MKGTFIQTYWMKVPFIQDVAGWLVRVVAGGAGVARSGWVGGTLVRTYGTRVPPTQTPATCHRSVIMNVIMKANPAYTTSSAS
ncbi:hypothetical protein JOD67_004102 [Tenggerimyces flavus]|nr:hypothetical protein [Tenggerimyces flavus]